VTRTDLVIVNTDNALNDNDIFSIRLEKQQNMHSFHVCGLSRCRSSRFLQHLLVSDRWLF